ncbi:MAG TPA: hypothetical protein VM553_11115 [Dongiaceae bacterium]|nr:hypothetical protein [Dongiaceae bacterium]
MIRKLLLYLLIMLLPMQAVAMSCLSVCKDVSVPVSNTATVMDHCAEMNARASTDHSNPPHNKSTTCWLGSVCLAQVAVFAMPIEHRLLTIERDTPAFPTVGVLYRSVILDHPQRPPSLL